jgi:hypothetical protein
MTTHFR